MQLVQQGLPQAGLALEGGGDQGFTTPMRKEQEHDFQAVWQLH